MNQRQVDLFWSRVRVGGPEECWTWIGYHLSNGYGQFARRLAHRVSWELSAGRVAPSGLHVCHTCDNRLCVNPAHLVLGDALANNGDRIAKGRDVRGEAVNTAKITRQDAIAIAEAYAAGGISQEALGKRYGLSQAHISSIVRGRAWIPGSDPRWKRIEPKAISTTGIVAQDSPAASGSPDDAVGRFSRRGRDRTGQLQGLHPDATRERDASYASDVTGGSFSPTGPFGAEAEL